MLRTSSSLCAERLSIVLNEARSVRAPILVIGHATTYQYSVNSRRLSPSRSSEHALGSSLIWVTLDLNGFDDPCHCDSLLIITGVRRLAHLNYNQRALTSYLCQILSPLIQSRVTR